MSSKLAVWFSKDPSLAFLKLAPWSSTRWRVCQRATALLSSSKMASLDHVGRLALLPPLPLQKIQKWFGLLCSIFNIWVYSKLISQTDFTHGSPSSPFHWLSFLPNNSSAHASNADLSLNTEYWTLNLYANFYIVPLFLHVLWYRLSMCGFLFIFLFWYSNNSKSL